MKYDIEGAAPLTMERIEAMAGIVRAELPAVITCAQLSRLVIALAGADPEALRGAMLRARP